MSEPQTVERQQSTTTRTGSCLCGSVKLTVVGEPILRNLCHCTSCQKASGSVFVSITVFETDQVTITPTDNDRSLISTYEDRSPESGDTLLRTFCARCGSPLTGQKRTRPDRVVVPVGVLDGDKTPLRPTVEYFCRSRAGWLGDISSGQEEGETPERFETLPGRKADTLW
ncbi:Mss4-like protein [Xylariaceae sp. FL0594]|nr:Mss4-like protein [Xylariaceae sp. FL0594]